MLKSAAARKRLVVLLISAAVGAAMSRSSVLGEFAPFAVIPAAVLPLPYGVAAALGALLPGCFTLSYKIVPLLGSFFWPPDGDDDDFDFDEFFSETTVMTVF